MKFRVSDTVTYTRSWIVDAEDEEDAIQQACDNGPDESTLEEEQTDNTPYEAEEITE